MTRWDSRYLEPRLDDGSIPDTQIMAHIIEQMKLNARYKIIGAVSGCFIWHAQHPFGADLAACSETNS